MINLEDIAIRRADEQMQVFRFDEIEKHGGMPMTGRTCKWPGCMRHLGKNNRSGYCYRCTQTKWRKIPAGKKAEARKRAAARLAGKAAA